MTEPLRRQALVNAEPARAFELFTTRLNAWWPLERYSVFGDGSVAFDEGRIVERSGDRESVWGEVTEWEPPRALAFTWHPGHPIEQSTDVAITFEPDADQTLITLVHTGWERHTDPESARGEYDEGWPLVLAAFVGLVDVVG
jgi:uncharacterized protein YndB with AHSA1/START domain